MLLRWPKEWVARSSWSHSMPTRSGTPSVPTASANRITHALLCGPYGQIFGTEKQCRKYFWAWDPNKGNVFPHLFSRAREARRCEITDYRTTFNLVNKLIAVEDAE